jgi:hypothetical protein
MLNCHSAKFCSVQSTRVGWQFDTVGRLSMTTEQYKLELPAPDTIKKYKLICPRYALRDVRVGGGSAAKTTRYLELSR